MSEATSAIDLQPSVHSGHLVENSAQSNGDASQDKAMTQTAPSAMQPESNAAQLIQDQGLASEDHISGRTEDRQLDPKNGKSGRPDFKSAIEQQLSSAASAEIALLTPRQRQSLAGKKVAGGVPRSSRQSSKASENGLQKDGSASEHDSYGWAYQPFNSQVHGIRPDDDIDSGNPGQIHPFQRMYATRPKTSPATLHQSLNNVGINNPKYARKVTGRKATRSRPPKTPRQSNHLSHRKIVELPGKTSMKHDLRLWERGVDPGHPDTGRIIPGYGAAVQQVEDGTVAWEGVDGGLHLLPESVVKVSSSSSALNSEQWSKWRYEVVKDSFDRPETARAWKSIQATDDPLPLEPPKTSRGRIEQVLGQDIDRGSTRHEAVAKGFPPDVPGPQLTAWVPQSSASTRPSTSDKIKSQTNIEPLEFDINGFPSNYDQSLSLNASNNLNISAPIRLRDIVDSFRRSAEHPNIEPSSRCVSSVDDVNIAETIEPDYVEDPDSATSVLKKMQKVSLAVAAMSSQPTVLSALDVMKREAASMMACKQCEFLPSGDITMWGKTSSSTFKSDSKTNKNPSNDAYGNRTEGAAPTTLHLAARIKDKLYDNVEGIQPLLNVDGNGIEWLACRCFASNGMLLGSLRVGRPWRHGGNFSDTDRQVLTAFAAQAGCALGLLATNDFKARQTRLLVILREAASELTSLTDESAIILRAEKIAKKLVGCKSCKIFLSDPVMETCAAFKIDTHTSDMGHGTRQKKKVAKLVTGVLSGVIRSVSVPQSKGGVQSINVGPFSDDIRVAPTRKLLALRHMSHATGHSGVAVEEDDMCDNDSADSDMPANGDAQNQSVLNNGAIASARCEDHSPGGGMELVAVIVCMDSIGQEGFDQADISNLESLGEIVAAAIRQARRFLRVVNSSIEGEGNSLSFAGLKSSNDVIDTLCSQAIHSSRASAGHVLIMDHSMRCFRLRNPNGRWLLLPADLYPICEPLMTKASLIIPNSQKDRSFQALRELATSTLSSSIPKTWRTHSSFIICPLLHPSFNESSEVSDSRMPQIDHGLLGVVCLSSDRPYGLRSQNIPIIEALCSSAAGVLQSTLSSELAVDSARTFVKCAAATSKLGSARNRKELSVLTATIVPSVAEVEYSCLFLIDDKADGFRIWSLLQRSESEKQQLIDDGKATTMDDLEFGFKEVFLDSHQAKEFSFLVHCWKEKSACVIDASGVAGNVSAPNTALVQLSRMFGLSSDQAIHSAMASPCDCADGSRVGIIIAANKKDKMPFSEAQASSVIQIGGIVGSSISLFRRWDVQIRHISHALTVVDSLRGTMDSVQPALFSNHTTKVFAGSIQSLAERALNCRRAVVIIVERTAGEEPELLWKDPARPEHFIKRWKCKGLLGECVKRQSMIVSNNVQNDPRFDPESDDWLESLRPRTMLISPVKNADGQVIAIIQAVNKMSASKESISIKLMRSEYDPKSMAERESVDESVTGFGTETLSQQLAASVLTLERKREGLLTTKDVSSGMLLDPFTMRPGDPGEDRKIPLHSKESLVIPSLNSAAPSGTNPVGFSIDDQDTLARICSIYAGLTLRLQLLKRHKDLGPLLCSIHSRLELGPTLSRAGSVTCSVLNCATSRVYLTPSALGLDKDPAGLINVQQAMNNVERSPIAIDPSTQASLKSPISPKAEPENKLRLCSVVVANHGEDTQTASNGESLHQQDEQDVELARAAVSSLLLYGDEAVQQAFENQKIVKVANNDDSFEQRCFPIISESGQSIGVIQSIQPAKGSFTPEDEDLGFVIASQLAHAVSNCIRHSELFTAKGNLAGLLSRVGLLYEANSIQRLLMQLVTIIKSTMDIEVISVFELDERDPQKLRIELDESGPVLRSTSLYPNLKKKVAFKVLSNMSQMASRCVIVDEDNYDPSHANPMVATTQTRTGRVISFTRSSSAKFGSGKPSRSLKRQNSDSSTASSQPGSPMVPVLSPSGESEDDDSSYGSSHHHSQSSNGLASMAAAAQAMVSSSDGGLETPSSVASSQFLGEDSQTLLLGSDAAPSTRPVKKHVAGFPVLDSNSILDSSSPYSVSDGMQIFGALVIIRDESGGPFSDEESRILHHLTTIAARRGTAIISEQMRNTNSSQTQQTPNRRAKGHV